MIERPYIPLNKDILIEKSRRLTKINNQNINDSNCDKFIKIEKLSLSRSLNKKSSVNESSQYPKNILDALHGIQYIKAKMKQDSNERMVKYYLKSKSI